MRYNQKRFITCRNAAALLLASFCLWSSQLHSVEMAFSKCVTSDMWVELYAEESPGGLPSKKLADSVLTVRPDARFIKPDSVVAYKLLLHVNKGTSQEIWRHNCARLNAVAGPPEFVFFDACREGDSLLICYKTLDTTQVEHLMVNADVIRTNSCHHRTNKCTGRALAQTMFHPSST